MTTYATALVDYMHPLRLAVSFGAYSPQSRRESFAAALPAAGGAVRRRPALPAPPTPGARFESFQSRGSSGEAAALPDEAQIAAAYAAGDAGPAVRLAGRMDHVLLGLVDRVLSLCWPLPRAHLQGPLGAGVHHRLRSWRPALVCFAWMAILGGTAIDLELTGGAEGAIIGASNTAKLFVTLGEMMSAGCSRPSP